MLKDNYYDLFLWLYNFYIVALLSVERWFSTQHITCLSRSPRILIITGHVAMATFWSLHTNWSLDEYP